MNFRFLASQYMKIIEKLDEIDKKLDKLIFIHNNSNLKVDCNLLDLPKHLQETMIALNKLKQGTASEVAKITGKARANESHNLNYLVNLGYASKIRHKREIIFAVKSVI